MSFTVEQVLGVGAQGIILAVFRRGNPMCKLAMKINHAINGALANLKREAILLQRLESHSVRHTIRCRDAFYIHYADYKGKTVEHTIYHNKRDRTRFAILMDRLPCGDVHAEFLPEQIFKAGLSLGRSEVQWIGTQMLEALQDLHARGYMHRDLKPENVVYDRLNRASTLLDFGCAKEIEKVDITNYVGTSGYWSPEYAFLIGYTENTDLWSLGALLVELFEGTPLIPTETVAFAAGSDEWLADYWHLMVQNMGYSPPREFMEAMPPGLRDRLFESQPDGSYKMMLPMSKRANEFYKFFEKKREGVIKAFPVAANFPLWQIRILHAAAMKKYKFVDMTALIGFIAPLLRYANRGTAAEVYELLCSQNIIKLAPAKR